MSDLLTIWEAAQHLRNGGKVEYYKDASGEWVESKDPMVSVRTLNTNCPSIYRISQKRQTFQIVVRGEAFDVPEPESKPLQLRAMYWVSCPTISVYAFESLWFGSTLDHERLKKGVVHLTKEAAACHGKAMIGMK